MFDQIMFVYRRDDQNIFIRKIETWSDLTYPNFQMNGIRWIDLVPIRKIENNDNGDGIVNSFLIKLDDF